MACLLKRNGYISNQVKPDIVVLDGDYSVPNIDDDATANFWNWLATTLMKIFFNATFTDLGPFRAIKYDKLLFKYGRQNLWMDCRNAA
jgi:hypothetical protein